MLSFIISANLDSGFFVIQKPVAPMRRLSENLEGPVKIASFSADDCKQLRDQLKSQNLRLEFTEDEVKVSPSLDGTVRMIEYWVAGDLLREQPDEILQCIARGADVWEFGDSTDL